MFQTSHSIPVLVALLVACGSPGQERAAQEEQEASLDCLNAMDGEYQFAYAPASPGAPALSGDVRAMQHGLLLQPTMRAAALDPATCTMTGVTGGPGEPQRWTIRYAGTPENPGLLLSGGFSIGALSWTFTAFRVTT